MSDIIDRLEEACKGYPAAWPHRLLHDALSEIERLRGVAQAPPGHLIERLEKYELRLLMGDQHDREMANDIGRAAHFLTLAVPAQAPMDLDYILPCDVHLPPATRIRKGCKLSTLLTGLRVREGAEFQAMVVPSTHHSPPLKTAPHNNGERVPSSDAAPSGGDPNSSTEDWREFRAAPCPYCGWPTDPHDCAKVLGPTLTSTNHSGEA